MMSIEEFIQHQAVSGCLTMEDRQYLELRDVQKVLQMAARPSQGQSPVFVSMHDICHIEEPETTADNAGRITMTGLHGDTLRGYRCEDIKAMYQWTPNGRCKGFSQELMCRFYGSDPHFNHMMRFMCCREAEYIMLLPRDKKPYLVIGAGRGDFEIAQRSVEYQTFVMECPHSYVPLPYYDGPIDIKDCTEPELMNAIY